MFRKKMQLITIAYILLIITITVYTFLPKIQVPTVKAQQNPTFYLEPQTFTDLNINDTVEITIKFENFTQLWTWQAGLQWDPLVLECTQVLAFKPFYSESVFAVLAPTRTTIFISGTIDNAIGKIYPPYSESLTSPGEGVNGTEGEGYNIMKVTFRVKGYAPEGSNINLTETKWTAYPDVGTGKPHNLINATIFTVTPPSPEPPTADFTWTPAEPVVDQNVTFDASASSPGFDGTSMCPITEYRWDFDGDLIFDKNVTDPVTTWTFTDPGDYPVTLEVYAPGAVPETDNITKTVTVVPPPPPRVSHTFIYVDPPRINATTIGENITVYIKIKDFVQLWTWQVGLQWDPTILNCTEVLAGPDFTEGVFKVLAPERYTLYVEGTINNTIGKIYPPYSESLTVPGEGVDSTPGEVYNLMKLTFQVVTPGIVDFHLYQTATWNFNATTTPPTIYAAETIIRDMFTVTLPEGDFPIEIITNSTGQYQEISDHQFLWEQNKISFVVHTHTFTTETKGFCNVTIPNSLMWDGVEDWLVQVNTKVQPILDFKQNDTHNLIYFTYPHEVKAKVEPFGHLVEIISPYAIPEFPPLSLLMALLIVIYTMALLTTTKIKSQYQK